MALNYAMSQQISTLIIGIDDIEQLEENIAIAKSFTPMTKNQMRYIESLTKADTERGSFFRKEFGGYDSKNKLEPPNKS